MRIRTQFLITLLFFGVLVTGISISAIVTNQQVTTVIDQVNRTGAVAQSANDLSYIANDYMIYQDSQQISIWQKRFTVFSSEVAKLRGQTPEQKSLVNNMATMVPQLKDVFDSVVAGLGTLPQNQAGTNAALLQVSWSRIAMQTQQFASDASSLSQLFVNQVNQAQRTNVIVVVVMVGIFVAYFILNYLMIERRTLQYIAALHAGTEAIGSGNLDYKIEEKQNNEIGDLSRAFNRMAVRLKEVTASKTDLEKEITERKKAEERIQQLMLAAQQEKERLSSLVNSIPDEVWFTDIDKNFTLANPSVLREFGAKVDGMGVEALANSLEVLRPDGAVRPVEEAPPLRALKGEVIRNQEEIVRTPATGELRYRQVSAAPVRDQEGNIIGSVSIMRDITKQKNAEKAIRENEQRFRAIAENTPDHLLVQDRDLRYILVINPQLGLTEKEMVGKTDFEILKSEDAEKLTKIKRQVIESGNPVHMETEATNTNGQLEYFSGSYVPEFNEEGKIEGLIGYFRNITESKRAEENLKEIQRILEEAQKIAHLGSWEWNVKTDKLHWSKELFTIYGVDPESFIPTMSAFAEFINPDDRKAVNEVMAQLTGGGDAVNIDFRIIRSDKAILDLHATSKASAFDENGKAIIYIGTTQDITARKKAEREVIRLNRELQAIGECDQAIVHSDDEKELLSEVCHILCSTGGYRLAWVGAVEHDEGKSVRPFAWCGNGEYLAKAKITWADTERGRGPTGSAVRNGQTHYFQDFKTEPAAAPWREAAIKFGYRSSIAIPLKDDSGEVFAIFTLYSAEPNYFDPAEVKLLEVLAGDLSFGINGIREKAKRRLAEAELAHVASIPQLNPNPIIELDADGRIIFQNPATKRLFPDILRLGIHHPFLSGWKEVVQNVKSEKEYLFNRQVPVGESWYAQTIIYVPRTNNYHIYARNVTDRKKAEDALIESESQMRAFFDSPGIMRGIVEVVDDSTVRHIRDNSTTSGFIGMDPEALRNKLSSELGEPAEIIRLWVEHYRRSLETGKPVNFEYLDRRGDNATWFTVTVSYLRTMESGQEQFGYVVQDISKRKKMEDKLQNNENRFRLLSEVNSLLLTSQQPEQIIHTIADKVMEFLKCDAYFNFIVDESKGHLRLNAYSGIPAEAAAEIEWLDFGTAICGCVARDHKPIVSENVQENGDERVALVRSYGIKAYASYPLRTGTKITGTVSFGARSRTSFTSDELGLIEIIADQISVAMQRKKSEDDLRESEERFNKAFYASPAALSISRVDDGKFVDVNPNFLGLFGYSRDEIVGHLATEIKIYDNPVDRAEIVRILKQKGHVQNYEVTARTKAGTEIKALTSAEQIEIKGQTHIIWTTIDITEREQAEALLRETTNYLNNLFNYANAPIIVWDPQFRISRFNPAFERLTGYKANFLLGEQLGLLFPPDKKEESLLQIRRTIQGERFEVVEIPVQRVDGEIRTILWNSANVYDNDGRTIIATIAQGQDITERKQTEEKLKTSETRYRRLFEASKDGILIIDADSGQIIDVNPFLTQMLGLSYKDFIGKNLWELGYFKDIVANKANFSELQSKKYIRYEDLPLRASDGREMKVEFVSNLYTVDHKTIIQCNIRDITKRKLAEEKLQETTQYLNNLLDYANASIIVWDSQLRITRFNHAFENLTGISAEEAIGKKLDILFPEDSKTDSMNHIDEARSGRRWEAEEIPILRKNGDVRIVLWNSATLLGIDGKKMVATIAQGQDITERKQAEEEVKKLNGELNHRATELEAANKELEAFSYSVSHDLRAPLRTMQGFSQALLEDCSNILDDQCKDYLQRIQGSAELMAQLIDDMLKLSRLTRADMIFNDVNLSEMAKSIANDLKSTQPKRKIGFDITPELIVKGDDKLLRVALHNLMENAWKFTGKVPKARIELGVMMLEGKTTYFVRDNGAGFDMAYVGKIFSPFQRLHTIAEFPGTGIGLASVRRIINRHGGRVWAEGKVGKGATFYFTLGG